MFGISVALTTYCGAVYIEEQLESIRKQILPVDEVIICDDCSKDNTVQIVEDYIKKYQLNGWRLIRNTKNLGYTKNYYKAIDACKNEIIFLCDQDDIWYPKKTKVMAEVMFKYKDIMALASSYDLCDGQGRVIDNPGVPNVESRDDGNLKEFSFQDFMGASFIRGCTMCFRKSVLDHEKLFDLSASLGHDWLINVYACLKGRCCILYKKLSMYRVHENNISFRISGKTELRSNKAKRIKGLREETRVLKCLIKENRVDTHQCKIVKKQLSFVERRLSVLEKRDILAWILLVGQLKAYKRIYRTFKGAIRVFVGDLLYSMKKE